MHLPTRWRGSSRYTPPHSPSFCRRAEPRRQRRSPGARTPKRGASCSSKPFASLLVAASQEHPLVIVLDDVQWADAASLDLLRHLVRASSRVRGILVATYRDSELA